MTRFKIRCSHEMSPYQSQWALDQKFFLYEPVPTSIRLPSAYSSLRPVMWMGAQPHFTTHSWSASSSGSHTSNSTFTCPYTASVNKPVNTWKRLKKIIFVFRSCGSGKNEFIHLIPAGASDIHIWNMPLPNFQTRGYCGRLYLLKTFPEQSKGN